MSAVHARVYDQTSKSNLKKLGELVDKLARLSAQLTLPRWRASSCRRGPCGRDARPSAERSAPARRAAAHLERVCIRPSRHHADIEAHSGLTRPGRRRAGLHPLREAEPLCQLKMRRETGNALLKATARLHRASGVRSGSSVARMRSERSAGAVTRATRSRRRE